MQDLVKQLVNIKNTDPSVVLSELIKHLKQRKFKDYEVIKVNKTNFPLVHAVGRGSEKTSYVVIMNKSKIKHTDKILVGKGVVYDSGGYYNKPYPHMNNMFFDKLGATLVFLESLETGLPGIFFLVSNMIGPESVVNGEIIVARNGIKVVVDHTDAEGRLGLADILTLATELNPNATAITVATLTGAAGRFVGPHKMALVHTDRQDIQLGLVRAHNEGLLVWPVPTHEDYDSMVESKLVDADISNVGDKDGAGSQDGAAFLRRFHSKLVHMDIAALDSDKDGNALGLGLKEIEAVIKLI